MDGFWDFVQARPVALPQISGHMKLMNKLLGLIVHALVFLKSWFVTPARFFQGPGNGLF